MESFGARVRETGDRAKRTDEGTVSPSLRHTFRPDTMACPGRAHEPLGASRGLQGGGEGLSCPCVVAADSADPRRPSAVHNVEKITLLRFFDIAHGSKVVVRMSLRASHMHAFHVLQKMLHDM